MLRFLKRAAIAIVAAFTLLIAIGLFMPDVEPSSAPVAAPETSSEPSSAPSSPEPSEAPEEVTQTPEAAACVPAGDEWEEKISVFLDASTGVSVVPGSGVAYFEGNDNVFLGAEITGPGVDGATVVFASPNGGGMLLPASNTAVAFAVPEMATAEDVWGVPTVGGSVEIVEECLD